ncbi:MAG: hypothetical protein LBS25_06590 [Candidatus Symbiothrix sp.]|jgi:uncharacterized membrane protein YccC|nr:hypothetical protein [Candidatus Symbiothrix sp.]
MKSNWKQRLLAVFAGTMVGSIIYFALTYFISQPKNWLHIGLEAFFCSLLSCCFVVLVLGRKKTKKD